MTASNPTGAPAPISITYGAVRLATVTTWTEAANVLRRQIADAYRPNGPMSSLNQVALAHEAHELAQIVTGPVNGLLVTSGPWAWGDSIRAAQEGAHGLTTGDLAYVHDYPNGYSTWTVDVKVKILGINAGTQRVTVRVTDYSASQFAPGEIVTVHASKLRRRNGGR